MDGYTLQQLAGVAVLLHPKIAVWLVGEGQFCHLPRCHIDVLGAVFPFHIPFRWGELLDSEVASLIQLDGYGPVWPGGIGAAHSGAVRGSDFEHGPLQALGGTFLQLRDRDSRPRGVGLIRGLRVIRFVRVRRIRFVRFSGRIMFKIKRGEDVQAKTPPLGKNRVPDGPGVLNGIHIAVALGKAVGGNQLLPGGGAAFIQGVLQELLLGLTHPLGHVDGGGGLVPDQVVPLRRLIVVEAVGHHVPEGVGPAAAVRVSEDHAGLHDDPVLGPQITVLVFDVFRPLLHGFVLTPAGVRAAGVVVCLRQAA